jgi:hypothetical protein
MRARRDYNKGLDALSGDDATQYANLAAMLAQGAGEIASNVEKKKAADKLLADQRAALPAAKAARAAATSAANEAQIMTLKASAEQDPAGPLHVMALQAQTRAAQLDAEARELEIKAGLVTSTALTPQQLQQMQAGAHGRPWYESIPWWGWGLGVAGAGFVGYKLLTRGSK